MSSSLTGSEFDMWTSTTTNPDVNLKHFRDLGAKYRHGHSFLCDGKNLIRGLPFKSRCIYQFILDRILPVSTRPLAASGQVNSQHGRMWKNSAFSQFRSWPRRKYQEVSRISPHFMAASMTYYMTNYDNIEKAPLEFDA